MHHFAPKISTVSPGRNPKPRSERGDPLLYSTDALVNDVVTHAVSPIFRQVYTTQFSKQMFGPHSHYSKNLQ